MLRFYSNLNPVYKEIYENMKALVPYETMDYDQYIDQWKKDVSKEYGDKNRKITMTHTSKLPFSVDGMTQINNYQGGIDDYYQYGGQIFLK